jgi:outer membrane lipoprotein-sorting protein
MIRSGNILFFAVFSVFSILVFNNPLSADTNQNLFNEIMKVNSGIRSIDAEIVQYINTPENLREVYKGKYIADDSGRFRIDYTTPSKQIVLNDGFKLYWYYPEDNLLYLLGNDKAAGGNSKPKINPLQEFQAEKFKDQFTLDYSGEHLYGFFKWSHEFIVKDIKNGLQIYIEVDSKSKVLLSKIIKNSEGAEIIKEIYTDYEKIKEIYVACQIDVYARTKTGITRNTTKYSNIRLNFFIPDSMFKMKFPDNVIKKYINGD